MNTAFFLILSGILIGAGLGVIFRDTRRNRRSSFVSERDPRAKPPEADIEITIARPALEERRRTTALPRIPASVPPAPVPGLPPASSLKETLAQRVAAAAKAGGDQARQNEPSATELLKTRALSVIEDGVVLATAKARAAGVAIDQAVEPRWRKEGASTDAARQLSIAGQHVAWLKLRLSDDGRLDAFLEAQHADDADLKGAASVSVRQLDAEAVSEMLLGVVTPAMTRATRVLHDHDTEAAQSERAWIEVAPLVNAALRATNGALAQAGAKLVPVTGPAWDPTINRHRLAVSVEVAGVDVARMHVERLPNEIEVAVGVREARLVDLGRRRRIPIEGMTIHALAELIASCAWPTIARYRQSQRSA
jgi:hypothetical protein